MTSMSRNAVYFKDRFGLSALPELWVFFQQNESNPFLNLTFEEFLEKDLHYLTRDFEGVSLLSQRDRYFHSLSWLTRDAPQKALDVLIDEDRVSDVGLLLKSLACMLQGEWTTASKVLQEVSHQCREDFSAMYSELVMFVEGKLRLWGDVEDSAPPFSVDFLRMAEPFLELPRSQEFSKWQNQMISLGWAESVRDLDYWLSKRPENSSLKNKVVAGTPFAEFQRRCLAHHVIPKHSHYMLFIGNGVDKSFDLEDLLNNGRSVKTGDLPLRLLDFITRDFYRPFSIYRIHEGLFPHQPYDTKQAALKIHQLIFRLNRELRIRRCRLEVRFHDGAYHLQSKQGLALLVPYRDLLSPTKQQDKASIQERTLSKLFGHRYFNSHEAAVAFKMSERSTRRYLLQLRTEGRLVAIGKGPSVRYCLQSPLANQPQSL